MAKPAALPLWDTNETDTVDPGATRKSDGWLTPAGVPEKPPYQVFNFWQNLVYKWQLYLEEQGVTEWDSGITYAIGAYVVASDNLLYRALVSQSGNTPVGDSTNWHPVGDLINTLVSTDATRGLTAAQGKALKDLHDAGTDIIIDQNGSLELKKEVFSIGDWNMYITGGGSGSVSKSVTHGLSDYKKIVEVSAMIWNDASPNPTLQNLEGALNGGGGYILLAPTTIDLFIRAGEYFDAALFDATSYNRGYVTITHYD